MSYEIGPRPPGEANERGGWLRPSGPVRGRRDTMNCPTCGAKILSWHGVQPPATPQEPEPYGPFFDPCGKCVTRTHCAHHDRCLAECVPADLRASTPSPEGQTTWQPIETADRSSAAINRRIWGVVNGETRLIAYGFSSHTKWLTWCLADQGVEDFDTCTPTHWQPYIVPSPPTPEGTRP